MRMMIVCKVLVGRVIQNLRISDFRFFGLRKKKNISCALFTSICARARLYIYPIWITSNTLAAFTQYIVMWCVYVWILSLYKQFVRSFVRLLSFAFFNICRYLFHQSCKIRIKPYDSLTSTYILKFLNTSNDCDLSNTYHYSLKIYHCLDISITFFFSLQ